MRLSNVLKFWLYEVVLYSFAKLLTVNNKVNMLNRIKAILALGCDAVFVCFVVAIVASPASKLALQSFVACDRELCSILGDPIPNLTTLTSVPCAPSPAIFSTSLRACLKQLIFIHHPSMRSPLSGDCSGSRILLGSGKFLLVGLDTLWGFLQFKCI